jgi:hypothetical protein
VGSNVTKYMGNSLVDFMRGFAATEPARYDDIQIQFSTPCGCDMDEVIPDRGRLRQSREITLN